MTVPAANALWHRRLPVAVLLLFAPTTLVGQSPAAAPVALPAADSVLIASENLIGEALFLRGFYAANNLGYDAAGRLEGGANGGGQVVDWTLSGVNILKAERVGGDAIELDGVRVAIRYNPDAHEFQRHPLNDQKMKLLVQLAPTAQAGSDGGVRQLRASFAAMFAIGIDPGLQHSAPPLWSHYFDPSLTWPPDGLTGQTIYAFPAPAGQAQDVSAPLLAHRADPRFTDAAAHDKVTGQVQLRVAIDPEGVPQHIAVAHPLGYGLDEQAAEAVAKWRFEPAMRAGKPVASAIAVSIDFQAAPPR